jgi:DTW domain-containing protein YfiP
MCAACLRAQSACICRFVTPVESRVELLVLQHPLEVHNAKNSARLLHLCLPSSRLLVGESFPAAELDAALHADGRTPLLLYPHMAGEAALGLPAPPVARRFRYWRGRSACASCCSTPPGARAARCST